MNFRRLFIFILLFALKANTLNAQNTIGLIEYSELSNEGYTLFSPINVNSTYLIDNCGFLVRAWESEYKPGLMAYLLEDGSLLRTARISSEFIAGGTAGRVELISWDNDLLWSYDFSSLTQQSHHDISPLPNGNFLVLLWERHNEAELVEMGRDTNFIPNNKFIWSEKIQEIKPIGTDQIEIVWEWNAWDHLIQDYDPMKSNFGTIAEHPERLNINYPPGNNSPDWMHMNSIDYNPTLDQISINARNFNEFYIIDHSTTSEEAKTSTGGKYGKGGDILFRWGNPEAYDKGDINDKNLFAQHDASWIPAGYPGAGNILLFNNGIGRPSGQLASSIEEIQLDDDFDGFYELKEDGRFGPDTSLWSYPKNLTEDFYSARISGGQRQRNGTTLICNGQKGKLFEIDNEENIVWQYQNPIDFNGPLIQGVPPTGSDIFKVRRYEYDYPAFTDKDLHPIAPIELEPNSTNCMTTGIAPSYLSLNYKIYPNPFNSKINLDLPFDQDYRVEIFNQVGQRLSCEHHKGASDIFTTELIKGLYFVKISTLNNRTVFTQTMIKL